MASEGIIIKTLLHGEMEFDVFDDIFEDQILPLIAMDPSILEKKYVYQWNDAIQADNSFKNITNTVFDCIIHYDFISATHSDFTLVDRIFDIKPGVKHKPKTSHLEYQGHRYREYDIKLTKILSLLIDNGVNLNVFFKTAIDYPYSALLRSRICSMVANCYYSSVLVILKELIKDVANLNKYFLNDLLSFLIVHFIILDIPDKTVISQAIRLLVSIDAHHMPKQIIPPNGFDINDFINDKFITYLYTYYKTNIEIDSEPIWYRTSTTFENIPVTILDRLSTNKKIKANYLKNMSVGDNSDFYLGTSYGYKIFFVDSVVNGMNLYFITRYRQLLAMFNIIITPQMEESFTLLNDEISRRANNLFSKDGGGKKFYIKKINKYMNKLAV